ncbi:hypothetical protein Tco_1342620 [Tanacetum coccineum]
MQDKMAEENIPAPTRTNEYFYLDELWFDLNADLLCNALGITPKDSAHPFMSPPAVDLRFGQMLHGGLPKLLRGDKMAEKNVLALTRTDEQLVPVKDDKTGVYSFHLDELWFDLNADLLHNALGITPNDLAHPFMSPPAGDLVMDFVNNLGYPKELQFVSNMHVNNLYQPWRTILSKINQCLTGKTSGSDKPRHLTLQMLWGVVMRTNVDYAKLIWEEFMQAITNFFSNMANIKIPTKKPNHLVILYCRFTKLIIYYLGSRHTIHRRP